MEATSSSEASVEFQPTAPNSCQEEDYNPGYDAVHPGKNIFWK
jgi:hypothetical protein